MSVMFWDALYAFPALVFPVGLIIGSFLNVVIFRYPLMLKQQWEAEHHSMMTGESVAPRTLSLVLPRSYCPHCLHPIRWYDNLPLLSWLMLKGHCRDCDQPISGRYPLVELLCGCAFLNAALLWPGSGWSIAVMALSALLIAGSFIDIDYHWLPDVFTQGALWLGLLAAWANASPLSLDQALTGVMAGYLAFYGIRGVAGFLMKKEALGMGDVWLFAGLGGWVGAYALPYVALIASVVGLVYGMVSRKTTVPIAFGPLLSLAGLMVICAQALGFG